MLRAVITGDVVHSTLLKKSDENRLYRELEKISGDHLLAIYRGDSFQMYLKNASEALKISFLIRCAAKKILHPDIYFDVRQSIGIGRLNATVRQLPAAKGAPFVLSGRAFDDMTDQGRRLLISTERELFNNVFELLSLFIDDIFETMTPKQAAVVYELLSGSTQQEIAKKLRKTQPTINRQAQAARWSLLQAALHKFDYFIKQLAS